MKISPLVSKGIRLRPATVNDYAALAIVERKAVGEPVWDRAAFRRYLKAANTFGFVAYANDVLVGFLLASNQGSYIEVDYVAVDPEFQRHGIGTRLLVKAMNALGSNSEVSHKDGNPRNKDLTNLRISARKTEQRLTATVYERNVVAQLFLRSVGFTAVNYFVKHREDECDAIGMELRLL